MKFILVDDENNTCEVFELNFQGEDQKIQAMQDFVERYMSQTDINPESIVVYEVEAKYQIQLTLGVIKE